MLSSKVAKRYAQGLLDFSTETASVETIFAEMKDVVKIMNESKELNAFFATPFVDAKKKIATAILIFENFSQTTKNFVSLVIKHGRETQLKNIARQFIDKVEDMNGVQRISLTTATQLSPNVVKEILKSTNLVNHSKDFDLKTAINTEILGGYILRVGDQQIDASVKSKLNELKKEFLVN
ncbi:MAG: ATP synthase F1 subunit delta [Flavobacteriaceae bacterium]|jgi:F-type H+-transporting ATPase subunit delta|nr:ATP synthase F1 subunit delta [Flavobacteriaceae bacterium]